MKVNYKCEIMSFPVDDLFGPSHKRITLTYPLAANDRKVGGRRLRRKRLRKKLLTYLQEIGKSKSYDAHLLGFKLVDEGNETKWSVTFEIDRPD